MTTDDKAFTGSIPQTYDRCLGPFLFEPYAADMAARLAGFDGDLLEIAAGTGIVTRALDLAVAPTARITATDLNQPMLDHAAGASPTARVVWRQADAMALPFADESFDVAVTQFGVMFFPDRAAAHRETRRVLRPDARYLFNVWDSVEHNEAMRVLARAVAACFPDDPPAFIERTPYGYSDKDRIRADLVAGGFSDVEIETVAVMSRTSAAEVAQGFCQGSPLRAEIVARDPEGVDRVTAAGTQALANRFGDGPVELKIQAHVVTARRP